MQALLLAEEGDHAGAVEAVASLQSEDRKVKIIKGPVGNIVPNLFNLLVVDLRKIAGANS